MNQNPKRIVIIEGDAFDADAIVAIVKFRNIETKFGVYCDDDPFDYDFTDEVARDAAMVVAVLAWRGAVGDVPSPHPEPIPPATEIETEIDAPDGVLRFWSDEKGRYFETYAGLPISIDGHTGERFVWNEGPPRRKNPLGEGASPIVRVYVDAAGKPLEQQPG